MSSASNIAYSIDSSNDLTFSAQLTFPDGTVGATSRSFVGGQYNYLVPLIDKIVRSGVLINGLNSPFTTPTLASGAGTLNPGTYTAGFSWVGASLETAISPLAQLTLSATGGVTVSAPTAIAPTGADHIDYYLSQQRGGSIAQSTVVAYRVSATDGSGETLACAEVSVTMPTNSNGFNCYAAALSWTAVSSATGYKIYGRTAGAELFIASTTGTAYLDLGTISPAGALPSSNTSALSGAPTGLAVTGQSGLQLGFVSSAAITGGSAPGSVTLNALGNATAPQSINQAITPGDVARIMALISIGEQYVPAVSPPSTTSGTAASYSI